MWKGQASESFNRLARSSLFIFLAIPVADFKPKTGHVHRNLHAAVRSITQGDGAVAAAIRQTLHPLHL